MTSSIEKHWSATAEVPPRFPFALLSFLPHHAWMMLIDVSLIVLHSRTGATEVPSPGDIADEPCHPTPERVLKRIRSYADSDWPVPDELWANVKSMLIYLPYEPYNYDSWDEICRELPLLLSRRVQPSWYSLVPTRTSTPSLALVDNQPGDL